MTNTRTHKHTHTTSIHSSVDGQLGCVYILAIVNNAAVNIGVHVSFQVMVFFGYMPRSGIAGACGREGRMLDSGWEWGQRH